MVSRYDSLDPRTQLEQTITDELTRALTKRQFKIVHQGTATSNAAGDRPDIIIENGTVRINVEVTQTTKSSADREFLPVKDHLEKAKRLNSAKKCYAIYVSPETHHRMINAIRDYNILNKDTDDLKIAPICFSTLQLLIDKLITSPSEIYPKKEILSMFQDYKLFVDDARVLEVIHTRLFSQDEQLRREIERQEDDRHQRTVEKLIKDLLKLEDHLREEKGITHINAIRDIIFLVFVKLYEEKREFEDKENRFKLSTFKKYQGFVGQEKKKKAIHVLFNNIKDDPELKKAAVFTKNDNFSEKLDDDFVFKFFLESFDKYHFYTTRVDGIGAAYEVLGMRTGKDVKAGQFFTPENIVKFMVRMAELDTDDVILDPACGTARFLVYAMQDMAKKAEKERNAKDKIRGIQSQQLFGTDYDLDVAKLAKMNMYIHGDGKSNIFPEDGLLLYLGASRPAQIDMDEKIDVILTNPPLGDQSYQKSDYDKHFKLERMEIIPKRNVTVENLTRYEQRSSELRPAMEALKLRPDITKSKRLSKSIKACDRKISELRGALSSGKVEWEVTGNQMKGGALFVGAAKHYLKSVRNKNEPIEWRGGKLLIVLDEGILNTDDYKHVVQFIKKYFYIKAIISLSRDTFVPVSSTTTKTSILYAIKKSDPDAVQQEPIFYGHAEKVGLDTRGRACDNHLFNASGMDGTILGRFFEFKQKVLASYDGLIFNRSKFLAQGFKGGTIQS